MNKDSTSFGTKYWSGHLTPWLSCGARTRTPSCHRPPARRQLEPVVRHSLNQAPRPPAPGFTKAAASDTAVEINLRHPPTARQDTACRENIITVPDRTARAVRTGRLTIVRSSITSNGPPSAWTTWGVTFSVIDRASRSINGGPSASHLPCSSNMSNAPVQRRAAWRGPCALSARDVTRECVRCNRLLARTCLRATAPSVRATDHAPRGHTQRQADKTPTCSAKPQLVTTYLLHHLFGPQSQQRPESRERKIESRCSPLRFCHANAPAKLRCANAAAIPPWTSRAPSA